MTWREVNGKRNMWRRTDGRRSMVPEMIGVFPLIKIQAFFCIELHHHQLSRLKECDVGFSLRSWKTKKKIPKRDEKKRKKNNSN